MNRLVKSFSVIIGVLFVGILFAQEGEQSTSFEAKQVFEAGFPKTLSFRADRLLLDSNYEKWKGKHILFNAITKKYLKEEVNMPLTASQWANQYAEEHPEKLMLIHLNGEGRSVNDETTFERYFPGHWVYESGTIPVIDIQKGDRKIQVENARPFSMKAYRVHGQNIEVAFEPHDILLVKVDKDGNRLWDQYEYASVTGIDYEKNELVLKRGQYGSTPRDFEKHKTYVAPIAGDIWGGNLMYYYNFSSSCPLDKSGQSAADVFVDEMKSWFGDGGQLAELDGIGFDVNYFEVKHETWDCNNDGVIDNGIVDGKNIWREGDIVFLQKIRNAFGPEFIITADGWKDDMQKAVGILNGMETEGLCRWNDGYRQISRTINQHVYWNTHNTTEFEFSYITSKLRNPADLKIADQLRRMGVGLSSCLGVTYSPNPNLKIPALYGGSLNKPNWLGLPKGPMQYALGDETDILKGEGLKFTSGLTDRFDFNDSEFQVADNQLIIKGSSEDRRKEMQIAGPEFNVESGDVMIFFEAKAVHGLVDLDSESLIPRKIKVKLEGLPDYPKEPMNTHTLYNNLAGFIGTGGYTQQMFYFRNVGKEDLRIIFEVEEQGEFAIKNLQVYNANCVIIREFENGIVLVNPSLDPVNVDLQGELSKKVKLKRLNTDETGNNGDKIRDVSSIIVPSLDALFLLKR